MNIQALREQRSQAVTAMRALTEKAGQEERDLSDAEDTDFNSLKTKLSGLDKQLERAQVIADAERSMQADPSALRRGHDGTFEQLCGDFQITRAIQAQVDARSSDCGRELEVSQELARRSGRAPRGILVPYGVVEQRDVLASNTGGNLVPNPLRPDMYIEPLRINPVVNRAGAMTLSDLVGDVDIPRQTAAGTTSTVSEHGAVSETSQTFDQVQLRPKTIGAYTEVSRRWLINSTPSGERVVRSDLTAAINQEVDRQALVANPAASSPETSEATGVRYVSGINSVAFGGGPTWALLQSMIGLVAADNAEMGQMSFIGNSYSRAEMLKTLMASSTDSRHLTEDPNRLLKKSANHRKMRISIEGVDRVARRRSVRRGVVQLRIAGRSGTAASSVAQDQEAGG